MTPKTGTPLPAAAITMQDVYYVVFRYKWLMAALMAVTAIILAVEGYSYTVSYESHAKVLVKCIVQTKPLAQGVSDSQVFSMINDPETVIAAEKDILTSFDVAKEAATEIGPEKILARIDHGTNLLEAAAVVQRGLTVPDAHTDVLQLTFVHPDREVVQPVVKALIDAYISKHNEVRKSESTESLNKEIDRITGELENTEKFLSDQRNQAGVLSLKESEQAIANQIAAVESGVSAVRADMAQEQRMIAKRRELLGSRAPAPTPTNTATAAEAIPPSIADRFLALESELAGLRNREQPLLSEFTTNYPQVQMIEIQIAAKEAERKQLLAKYPNLAASHLTSPVAISSPSGIVEDPVVALNAEIVTAQGLEARYETLTNQLAIVKQKAAMISAHEGAILDAQRDADIYGDELKAAVSRREEAKTDELVGSQGSSISVIEQPTPPSGQVAKMRNILIASGFGGLILALGLPFFIELYLDQTLKRPSDVRMHLKLPFFVSVPRMDLKGKYKRRRDASLALTAPVTDGSPDEKPDMSLAGTNGSANGSAMPWEEEHALYPYFETLRDRLMTYFEMINLTHKPKLVAVTSCNVGAGVTTTAAGLAASLSQTGDGNVLLVNMNNQNGEAQHFYKGKPACGLEAALEKTTRDNALVQERLYMAGDNSPQDRLPRILPKRFSHLVGKMKASDYDYIIFDMPPMSQISITPRLARFMDMVLLVVESEKTPRELARNAGNLLSESKTNIGIVLNKSRRYLPRRLQEEI